MATKGGRTTAKPTRPAFGPAARRARERRLDALAVGSRAAKHGTPVPEDAPAPAPVRPPSRFDAMFRLAKTLRKAGAPARAAAREQAADRAKSVETKVADEAAKADARRLAAQVAEDEAREDTARQVAARAIEKAAAERARAERARLAEETRAAVAAAERERGRKSAARVAHDAARAAADARAAIPAPTAAIYRGRVDPRSPYGALLVMAPAPGGRAARCFAELLRRAVDPRFARHSLIVRGGLASEADQDDGPEPGRLASEDLLALSDLYRSADGFYRTLDVPQGEGAPLNGNTLRAIVPPIGGSISSQLAEG